MQSMLPPSLVRRHGKNGPTIVGSKRALQPDHDDDADDLLDLLIKYVDLHKYEYLARYLQAGGDVNIQLDHSYLLTTALCEASKHYDYCAMQSMFKHSCDVNLPDGYGNTPLFLAVKSHKVASMCMLLEQGADVDLCNRWGKTPLVIALENSSNRCAELLVQAGACVDVPIAHRRRALGSGAADSSGATSPLLYVLLSRPSPLPMAELLVRAGARTETLSDDTTRTLLSRPGTTPAFIELLLAAGFRLRGGTWLREHQAAHTAGALAARDRCLFDIITQHATHVSALKSLARTRIRKCIASNRTTRAHLEDKLKQLELPKSITRYLSLGYLKSN